MLQPSPFPVTWVPRQPIKRGCPPGLENLLPLDYLRVEQQVDVLEIFSSYEQANKYYVKDRGGQILFYLEEDSSFCARNCFPTCRPFRVNVYDITQEEVIHMEHPAACCCNQILVDAPVGVRVGMVQQNCTLCSPSLTVKDGRGKDLFHIQGPCCSCKRKVEFKVMALNKKSQLGMITKVWGGFTREWFTDADNFDVSFPADLDVRLKAVMLGGCILVDMLYFESCPEQPQDRSGRRGRR